VAEINAASFDIVFALWSREAEAGVDCEFSCNPQLQLFDAEPSALRETGMQISTVAFFVSWV
jgi:hypothetical protein